MIKWIISDMDGTLLVDNNRLPEDFDEVMQMLKDRNIMFSPASGRQYQALAYHFPSTKTIYCSSPKTALTSASMTRNCSLIRFRRIMCRSYWNRH